MKDLIESYFDDRNIFEIKASKKSVEKIYVLLKKLYDSNIFELFSKENIIQMNFGEVDTYCQIDGEEKTIRIETGSEGLSNLLTIIKGNKDIDINVVNSFRKATTIKLVKENIARETAIKNYLKYESVEVDFDEYVPCFEIDNYCLRYNDYIRKSAFVEIYEIFSNLLFIIQYIKDNNLKYTEKDSLFLLRDKGKVVKTNIIDFAVPVCFVNLNPLVAIRNRVLINEYQNIEFKIYKCDEKCFRNSTKIVSSFVVMIYDLNKRNVIFEKKVSHSDHFVQQFNSILIDFFLKYGVAKNVIVTNLFDAFVLRSVAGDKIRIIKSECKNIDNIINKTPMLDA